VRRQRVQRLTSSSEETFERHGPAVRSPEELKAELGGLVERYNALPTEPAHRRLDKEFKRANAALFRYVLDSRRIRGAAAEDAIAEFRNAVRDAEVSQ